MLNISENLPTNPVASTKILKACYAGHVPRMWTAEIKGLHETDVLCKSSGKCRSQAKQSMRFRITEFCQLGYLPKLELNGAVFHLQALYCLPPLSLWVGTMGSAEEKRCSLSTQ